MIENINFFLDLLEKTKGVTQNPGHHPEGDVLNHSLQVTKCAMRETNDIELIMAAMLHDVGKYTNTLGHDKIAVEVLGDRVTDRVSWLILNHLRIWYLLLGEMRRHKKVRDLIDNPWLADLIMLARWDKMGRNPNVTMEYDRGVLYQKLDAYFV